MAHVELPMIFATGPVPGLMHHRVHNMSSTDVPNVSGCPKNSIVSTSQGARLQPMVVDTPLPFSPGVVMTTGGGAEADRETWGPSAKVRPNH